MSFVVGVTSFPLSVSILVVSADASDPTEGSSSFLFLLEDSGVVMLEAVASAAILADNSVLLMSESEGINSS